MKIAFVAMSGVRACDEELMRFGLTLPGFVERSKVVASLPSLGLLTLAGMTPAHHERRYYEVPDLSRLDPQTFDAIQSADLVAISSFTAQIREAYALANRLRRSSTQIVMGGLHVSTMAEEAGQHCDAVVIGEGELHWAEVLEDAESGRLKPCYASPGINFDLTHAPLPAYELLDIKLYNRLTVQTSRGCPFKCEFCASSILLTPKYQQKPVDRVLAEIDRIRAIWPNPFIEFADDNSVVNRAYWHELLPQLRERRIRWFTETDVSVARDEELLRLMRESGCAQVLIGLESPTGPELDGLELRRNWKKDQWPAYAEAIRTIQSHGISVNGCFVLGLDTQGPEVFNQVFAFVEATGLHEVQITLQTPFPGTPLYERLRRERRLLDETAWSKCSLFDINFVPKKMTVEQLRTGFRELGARLYSQDFTTRRRNRFRRSLRDLRQNIVQ